MQELTHAADQITRCNACVRAAARPRAQAFAQHRSRIVGGMDLASLRRALDACDVLGLSHYAPMPVVHLTPASFEVRAVFVG